MEVARYTFEQKELGAISKAKRRALGGVTLTLLRRLGSPEQLSFAEDAVSDIAAIMSPLTLSEEDYTTIIPVFNARTVDGKHIVQAQLPGAHRRRFLLMTDVTYLLREPRHDPTHQNLLAITDIRDVSITCWPDRFGRFDFPGADELTGDFAVDIAAKALRRLCKQNPPDDIWQTVHDELE